MTFRNIRTQCKENMYLFGHIEFEMQKEFCFRNNVLLCLKTPTYTYTYVVKVYLYYNKVSYHSPLYVFWIDPKILCFSLRLYIFNSKRVPFIAYFY